MSLPPYLYILQAVIAFCTHENCQPYGSCGEGLGTRAVSWWDTT